MNKVSLMLLISFTFALFFASHYGVEARGPIATCICKQATDCNNQLGCLVCGAPNLCVCINGKCVLSQFPSPAINIVN
ncbi:hypothetical protein LINGRAHAP2_LOCUS12649 [Linum grandiflorum]